jgi:hypothetical protein
MPVLDFERHELVAQGVARGLAVDRAARVAGYEGGASGSLYQRVKKADFKARVEEIKKTLDWGATRNLGPVIDELAAAAKSALAKALDDNAGSAAWLKAGGELMKIIGEMKGRLPPDQVFEVKAPKVTLTSEEWARKYRPAP